MTCNECKNKTKLNLRCRLGLHKWEKNTCKHDKICLLCDKTWINFWYTNDD